MENNIPEEFAELSIPKRSLANKDSGMKYRVYTDPHNFMMVNADTALEAIRKSGINNPFRIIRDSTYYEKMLSEDMISLSDDDDGATAIAEEARIKTQLGSDVSGLIETPEEEGQLPNL